MKIKLSAVERAASDALIKASTSYRPDQMKAFEQAIKNEGNKNAKWIFEQIIENAVIAEKKKLPLCDDTGIPHVLLEIGKEAELDGNIGSLFTSINNGISHGLRTLPGRPMAVRGNDFERIAQSRGLYEDPGMLLPAPIRIKQVDGKAIRLTVLMLGGGPEIRSRTYRIFHHHTVTHVQQQIAEWAVELAQLLGCTPCVPAIGIGRTHYEAASLMLEAMANKEFGCENEMERYITTELNKSDIGALGLGGTITALNTFIKIGPQRASGVRIVSLRIGCLVDPRKFSIILD
jgi:fumarate hydratase subunit alpha